MQKRDAGVNGTPTTSTSKETECTRALLKWSRWLEPSRTTPRQIKILNEILKRNADQLQKQHDALVKLMAPFPRLVKGEANADRD